MNRRKSARLIEKMGKKKSPKKGGRGGRKSTILDYLHVRGEEEVEMEGATSEQEEEGGDRVSPPPSPTLRVGRR